MFEKSCLHLHFACWPFLQLRLACVTAHSWSKTGGKLCLKATYLECSTLQSTAPQYTIQSTATQITTFEHIRALICSWAHSQRHASCTWWGHVGTKLSPWLNDSHGFAMRFPAVFHRFPQCSSWSTVTLLEQTFKMLHTFSKFLSHSLTGAI